MQKFIINIKIELANNYFEQYSKNKQNQLLHATYAANKASATAYILGARLTDNYDQSKQWTSDGRNLLNKLESLK